MDKGRRIRKSDMAVPLAKKTGGSRIEVTDSGQIKSKIPAQVRNNLENALVGLCDVWFEEIKPHLLRNNIKVHCQRDDVDNIADDTKQGIRCSHPILNRMVEKELYQYSHLEHEVYSASATPPPTCAASCELCRLLLGAAGGISRAVFAASSQAPILYRHSTPAPAVPATAVLLPAKPF